MFTIACAKSTSVLTFGIYRFSAGLELGGCLPAALTLATEFAAKGKSASQTTLIMTGYHLGAVLTALLALLDLLDLLDLGNGFSWRWMFVIDGVPGLIPVPVMIELLPESADRAGGAAGPGTLHGFAGRGCPIAAG